MPRLLAVDFSRYGSGMSVMRVDTKAAAVTPQYFRLPKPGTVDPFFGGNRSFWNELVLPTPRNGFNPPVESITFKQPGATRGARFIVYASANAYFDEQRKKTAVKEGVCA